ncbi:hypothetical protein ANCDUO_00146 [Ancylostoma duodenale]|uniref:Protein kinase domain-containing protein n=1 Tax=Ancylostoma duodenale TaxID=51022 RepID=A0A0C2E259_9BILA|nr:hypothetical protein ANCDUO_00146 [Ancylostoma duodenale]
MQEGLTVEFGTKIIQLVEHFDYHGHCCLVFKLYGLSVFDFQRKYNFRPYHIEDTRHIMYQICYAVKFLHDNKLTHTDLKPENVLFVCDDSYTEKVGNMRKIEDSDAEERELFELMHAMMQFEPAARITMSEALQSPFFDRLPENKRIPGLSAVCPLRRPGIMDPLHRSARGHTVDLTGEGEAD